MGFHVKVYNCAEWGAKPARKSFQRTQPKYIVIHHTDTPNTPKAMSKGTLDGAKQLARDVQGWHMDGNGWSDSGHNYLNSTGGYILEGRHDSLIAALGGSCIQSAHAGDNLGNQSPGIENEGNFNNRKMEERQWASLVALCASLCQSCGISPDNIKGHRDFSATDCPGDELYKELPRLRKEVKAYLVSKEGKEATPVIPGIERPTLRKGDFNEYVGELQLALRKVGFDQGAADQIFGENTRIKVYAFQKANGLTPDGVVGINTWMKLLG